MTNADTLRDTRIPLINGSGAIPAMGFGTLIPYPVAIEKATRAELEAGFRHLDCAERYRNEQAVGDAMQAAFKEGVVRREDIFVTTKVWNTNHRPERVKPAFDASRRRLQIDTIDCYLIHTPFAFQPAFSPYFDFAFAGPSRQPPASPCPTHLRSRNEPFSASSMF